MLLATVLHGGSLQRKKRKKNRLSSDSFCSESVCITCWSRLSHGFFLMDARSQSQVRPFSMHHCLIDTCCNPTFHWEEIFVKQMLQNSYYCFFFPLGNKISYADVFLSQCQGLQNEADISADNLLCAGQITNTVKTRTINMNCGYEAKT